MMRQARYTAVPLPKVGASTNPLTDTEGSAFEDMPSFLLTALGNRLMVRIERHIRRELGLGLTEWRIVMVVGSEPGASSSRISGVTGVNKANVSRAVRALEKRGILKRRSEPDHARRYTFVLTARGREMFRHGNELRVAGEYKLLMGLGEIGRTSFCEMLRHLMRNLDEMPDLGDPELDAIAAGKKRRAGSAR